MIVPVINSVFTDTAIQIADTTPADNNAGSSNYNADGNNSTNTNYKRADLDSVAIQVIIDKCYKGLIILPEETDNTYEVTLTALDLTSFPDAVYQIVYVLLFDETAGDAVATKNSTTITLTQSADKAELLKNKVILISNQLYDIDVTAITDADKIELMTPYTGESGTYSMLHGYRQNDSLLQVEGIKSCVYKKIANMSCKCGGHSAQELYMNYKSILANFELGNYGKTIDLMKFANTVCSDPKVKNCGCSC